MQDAGEKAIKEKAMEPSQIWANVADRVRQEMADPTVWLAMRAAQPLLIDGSFFVAALPPQDEYLAVHLLNNQATTAIEEALRDTAGRILAFRLIIGSSVADWAAEKARDIAAEQRGFAVFSAEHEPPSRRQPFSVRMPPRRRLSWLPRPRAPRRRSRRGKCPRPGKSCPSG